MLDQNTFLESTNIFLSAQYYFNSLQSSVINIKPIQALLFNLPICASVKKTSILLLANIHKTIFLSSSKLLFLPDFKSLVKVYSADMLNLLTVLPRLYQILCSLLGAFIWIPDFISLCKHPFS